MAKLSNFIVTAFPFWVILGVFLTFFYPHAFTWFSGNFITYGLGIIMLGMGLTITVDDFKNVLKMPKWVITGLVLHFTVMPFLGWAMGIIFHLPVFFAVGLILVACCPSGTASNVVCYLARANVPLSVTTTSISTLTAIFMTPLLSAFIIGSKVDVNGAALFFDTLKVILLPVMLGIVLNRYLPKFTSKILPFAPIAATFTIVLIVSSIIGAGRNLILNCGWRLIFAVIGLHACGFFLGYVLTMITAKDKTIRQTISIEVGMQNSGLGVVLAKNNFPDPATAIPSAISSATHSLIGSLLAGIWRIRNKKNIQSK
jgi:BASS family bile acid:Na+ symporter